MNGRDPSGMYQCEKRVCDEVREPRKELDKSIKSLRDRALSSTTLSSKVAFAKAANQLQKSADALGTENDSKGPKIVSGILGKSLVAQWDPSQGISGRITNDFSKIGGRVSVARVLAHEGRHAYNAYNSIYQGRGSSQQLRNEMTAYSAQAIFEIGVNKNGQMWKSGASSEDFRANLTIHLIASSKVASFYGQLVDENMK